MRRMSFAITPAQIADGSKTVTRRDGWRKLKAGDDVLPVLKAMGLKKGERHQVLAPALKVLSVRQEALQRMIDDSVYGAAECRREGFPDMTPEQFVQMFCATHRGCTPQTLLTRIEFYERAAHPF